MKRFQHNTTHGYQDDNHNIDNIQCKLLARDLIQNDNVFIA